MLPAVNGLDLGSRAHTARVSLTFLFPVLRAAMRSWRPDFFEENNKKAISAYVHLEGLAKSFSLTCSSLQLGISWTRGLVSYIPKVFFPSAHGEFFWPWDPIILFEMINLRVSMNATCEVFVKGFRLIFFPLKTEILLGHYIFECVENKILKF